MRMSTPIAPLPDVVELPRIAPATDARLVVRGVTKTWNRKRGVLLQGVDLELEPGMLAALVGPNGAGKTTLLRIMSGLIDPDGGTVTLEGLHPHKERREYQRRLGYLSAHQGGLYARLTVRAHLDLWARLALIPKAEHMRLIEAAVDRFGLRELYRQRVDRLSMGQRQRVRLAMAFLHEPSLVLLDEPRNSLDEDGIGRLLEVLRTFTEAGGTALWCAPTDEGVADVATAVFELADGRLKRR
jgi:ABC-2 type transport system ATP-binding protein